MRRAPFTRALFTVALPLASALLAAGCGGKASPCDGVAGVCIGAHISGNAVGLEQLAITIDQPTTQEQRSPATPSPIKLPAKIALLLPAGTQGAVNVSIDGLDRDGTAIARTARSVTIPASGRVEADFVLNAGVTGGDDMATPPDMATGIVIANAVDTIVYETEPLALSLTATDPESSDLVLTATGVPSTATFTPSGASAMLTWTPTATESGSYPVTITATSASNPARTGSTTFNVIVKNFYDPVLNPFSVSPDQLALDPVGDVDGDGKADWAYCTTTGSNPVGYSIQIIYGDATGLPTARPYPAMRTRNVTFSGPAGSTNSNPGFASCTGGDFDGDGKSDVLISDGLYTPPGGATNTGAYFVAYGQARADTTPTVTAQLTMSGGDQETGFLPVVGDWNGDGLADFAALPGNVAAPGAAVNVNVYIWTGQFPRRTGVFGGQAFSHSHFCGEMRLIGFAAMKGDNGPGGKKAHPLVWYDGSVTAANGVQTSGTCTAANGGLRGIIAGLQVNGFFSSSLPMANIVQPFPFQICDVDGDGIDDLISITRPATNWTVAVSYGGVNSWGAPVDVSKSTVTMAAGQPRLACWRTAFGPTRFLLSDPGNQTGNGFLGPGVIYAFDIDAAKLPKQTKMLSNFTADMTFTGFGEGFKGPQDLDGDGKPDLLMRYQNGFADVTFAWMVYGR
jgi:hypothetical protein